MYYNIYGLEMIYNNFKVDNLLNIRLIHLNLLFLQTVIVQNLILKEKYTKTFKKYIRTILKIYLLKHEW